jgi:hypothetical protein
MSTRKSLNNINRAIGGELEAEFTPKIKIEFPTIEKLFQEGLWFTSARGGLIAILNWLKEKNIIKSVLVPDYLCGSLILALEFTKLPYSLYPLDKDLRLEFDIRPHTAVLAINYFGFPNPMVDYIRNFVGKDIVLVEDCAQCLFPSTVNKIHPHYFYQIYSMRKFLGIPAGGCLMGSPKPNKNFPVEDCVPLWKGWTGRFFKKFYRNNIADNPNSELESIYLQLINEFEIYLDQNPDPKTLPEALLKLLPYQDFKKIFTKRRENYQALLNCLPKNIQPLFTFLPDDTCPMGCPVIIPEKINRDWLQGMLQEQFIYCPIHWPVPSQISERITPYSKNLYLNTLTLPIDQRYEISDMYRIADAIDKLVTR